MRWRAGAAGLVMLVAACGSSSTETDLLFDLATVNAIATVPVDQVVERGTDEVTERTGAAEAVVDDLILYEILPPTDLARVDEVSVMSDEGLWFYRDPTFQSGLSTMVEPAATVVAALEQRPIVTDVGISVQARIVALGADGTVVASDWSDGASAAQLDAIGAVVITEGLSWSEALATLAVAARQAELGEDVSDPLGARLLDAARRAG